MKPSLYHRLPHWQIAALVTVASLWVTVSILLVLGRGDVETYRLGTFKDRVRPDAFIRLNPTFTLMWVSHTGFLVFGVVAMIVRESDLFTVLIIGKILALLVAVTSQQWVDPDWGICLSESAPSDG